jgi:hypothetical protein
MKGDFMGQVIMLAPNYNMGENRFESCPDYHHK